VDQPHRPTHRPTLEELQDRFEIDELLTRYAQAIDDRAFDLLDSVFKAWLTDVLGLFPAYQHLVGNRRVVLDGDTATAVSMFHNPMAMADGTLFFCGGEYNDRLVRTPDGWRIAERVERTAYATAAIPTTNPAPPAR
jgi:hypothetical protein